MFAFLDVRALRKGDTCIGMDLLKQKTQRMSKNLPMPVDVRRMSPHHSQVIVCLLCSPTPSVDLAGGGSDKEIPVSGWTCLDPVDLACSGSAKEILVSGWTCLNPLDLVGGGSAKEIPVSGWTCLSPLDLAGGGSAKEIPVSGWTCLSTVDLAGGGSAKDIPVSGWICLSTESSSQKDIHLR